MFFARLQFSLGVAKIGSGRQMASAQQFWQRPESVPIPTVWARYESKKPMPNGKTPIFRIQDYTEEWRDHVIHNMTNFFLRDEPISKSLGLREDPAAVEEFQKLFLAFLDRKMGLIAIVENLEELGDKSLPPLAGCNITAVVTAADKMHTSQSQKLQKILDALEALEEKVNIFEYYQVTELMYALGLSVDSAYRGHSLGLEILKARFPLCKAAGIKVTATVFTAGAAQHSAEKAGFKTLSELFYSEYKDKNGEVVFRVSEPKSMKMMGIRIP